MKRAWFLAGIFTALFALNVVAQDVKPEHEPLKPRVPPDLIAAAKARKNPLPSTPENVAAGQELFVGKATCFVCHGNEGKGDGAGAAGTQVGPRNFTNPEFHKKKTCGEMFWVTSNGTKGDFSKKDAPSHPDGTGMVPYLIDAESALGLTGTPTVDENELWQIIIFEKSLGGAKCE